MQTNKFVVFILIFILAQNVNCQNKQNKEFDINDSSSVREFIKKVNLCEKLDYVEKNKSLFVNDKGYSGLVLENISKESNRNFFLAISNGGIVEEEKNKIIMLQEQIDEIKILFKCKK